MLLERRWALRPGPSASLHSLPWKTCSLVLLSGPFGQFGKERHLPRNFRWLLAPGTWTTPQQKTGAWTKAAGTNLGLPENSHLLQPAWPGVRADGNCRLVTPGLKETVLKSGIEPVKDCLMGAEQQEPSGRPTRCVAGRLPGRQQLGLSRLC